MMTPCYDVVINDFGNKLDNFKFLIYADVSGSILRPGVSVLVKMNKIEFKVKIRSCTLDALRIPKQLQ